MEDLVLPDLEKLKKEEADLVSRLNDLFLPTRERDERRLWLIRNRDIPEAVQKSDIDRLHAMMTSNRWPSDVLTLPVPLWPQE